VQVRRCPKGVLELVGLGAVELLMGARTASLLFGSVVGEGGGFWLQGNELNQNIVSQGRREGGRGGVMWLEALMITMLR